MGVGNVTHLQQEVQLIDVAAEGGGGHALVVAAENRLVCKYRRGIKCTAQDWALSHQKWKYIPVIFALSHPKFQ